jgi:biotin-dependent carboxylase-like uncharacterized protein
MSEPSFEVLEGGLLTTVQDAGRPGWTHLGVPESGAADPWSLAVANLLAGNESGAAALELTIVGPTLRALRPVTIALAGADLGARAGPRRLAPGRTHRLATGEVLELPGGGPAGSGSRAILAVPGGFDVPEVLGSRSTCLSAGFGGHEGRPLRSGDLLVAGAWEHGAGPDRIWPEPEPGATAGAGVTLRVLPGPAPGLEALLEVAWRVAAASDRVGTRLEGPIIPEIGGETLTHGVPWGAIQVPPDGRPIVLGPDHQTTGGYRVVGAVCSADLPVLGQLAPGSAVRLAPATHREALDALRARRAALHDGATALRDAAGWDTLVHTAGG